MLAGMYLVGFWYHLCWEFSIAPLDLMSQRCGELWVREGGLRGNAFFSFTIILAGSGILERICATVWIADAEWYTSMLHPAEVSCHANGAHLRSESWWPGGYMWSVHAISSRGDVLRRPMWDRLSAFAFRVWWRGGHIWSAHVIFGGGDVTSRPAWIHYLRSLKTGCTGEGAAGLLVVADRVGR